MAARALSLQDRFLNSARKSKAPLTIFLVKGVKLQGVVTWFDSFSLLLRRDGQSQLVYKHSISTVMPACQLDLDRFGQAEPAPRPALQDAFLSAAEQERQAIKIYLVNGVMLQGEVVEHDQFSILLERSGQAQLVYKHAISTIQPEHPLALGAGGDGEAAE
ncbi:MAG TPA: RNA chaperone Hfq [Sphingomicrobium sp.]|nr:RNA chaperone Hfq [Sphingomicrobium sp.]